MWTLLILVVSATTSPLTALQFSSREKCEAAKAAYESIVPWALEARAVCVEN